MDGPLKRGKNQFDLQKNKTFLHECYDTGEKTGSKLTADSIHKLMRTKHIENKKFFGLHEYLTQERIVAFFSHCKAKKYKDEKSEEEDGEECDFLKENIFLYSFLTYRGNLYFIMF